MIDFTQDPRSKIANIISYRLLSYSEKYPNAIPIQLVSYYAKDICCPTSIILKLYQEKFTIEEFKRIPTGIIFSILKSAGYSKIE